MQGKTCIRCGKEKPFSQFDFNSYGQGDGYVRRCKSCLRIQNAIRYDCKKNGKPVPSFNDFETLSGMRVFNDQKA